VYRRIRNIVKYFMTIIVYRHKIYTNAKNYEKIIVNVQSPSTINTTLLTFLEKLHKNLQKANLILLFIFLAIKIIHIT